MFAEERRRKIVEHLKEKGKVTVKELSKIFKTSEVTIRKDLEILESIGELIRTHGGAILPHGTRAEWDFFKKMSQHRKEKEEIAKKAVSLLKEGETIILDSGTTPYYIAKTIKESGLERLTIVTNNIYIAELILESRNEVILLGGYMREHSLSLVGPFSVEQLEKIHVDKAFLGTTGFSEKGFMTPSIVEAEVKHKMVEIAEETFIVTDSSKFKRKAFALFCTLDEVDGVITDRMVPEEAERILLESGLKVFKV